jgi:hypothetical protein
MKLFVTVNKDGIVECWNNGVKESLEWLNEWVNAVQN